MKTWRSQEGSPNPLGATWVAEDKAYNFAVYSQTATALAVLLYGAEDFVNPVFRVDLDPLTNKSDDIWHCRVSAAQAADAAYYSLRAESDPAVTGAGTLFPNGKELLDPYAREVFFPPDYQLGSGSGEGSNAGKAALGVLPSKTGDAFDWGDSPWPLHGHDLLVYEMHVRGFTMNANFRRRSFARRNVPGRDRQDSVPPGARGDGGGVDAGVLL